MNGQQGTDGERPTLTEALEQVRQDHEQTQNEIKEVTILIRQSSGEVDKISRHNSLAANKIRHMEANLDTFLREDIKEIYHSAQEDQMRLFMMSGQLEQLQEKHRVLERHAAVLGRILDAAGQSDGSGMGSDGIVDTSELSGVVRIINAQETERQQLARRMHDGPAQSLTNLILQAEICERLFDRDQDLARSELANLKASVTVTFRKVRDFIFELRPMMLDDLGLIPTLRRYIEDFQEKTGLECDVNITGKEQRLQPHAEVTVFRSLQSLLNNVNLHASATKVDIMLDLTHDQLLLRVEDNGVGFDVDTVLEQVRQRNTMGLSTLVDQVEMIGGQVRLESDSGQGARAEILLPL